jgi:hypothetical protein
MRKWTIYFSSFAIALAILFGAANYLPPTSHADSNAPFFSATFTVPASGSATTIPNCTTSSSGCIPNRNQVGHTISYVYSAPNQQPSSTVPCGIVLNGSNDATNWQTFAASGNIAGNLTGSFSGNQFFTWYQLKLTPCISSVTLTYTGFGSQQPTNVLSTPLPGNPFSIASLTTLANWPTPAYFTGFQCYNPASSGNAYLQLLQYLLRKTPPGPTFNTIFSLLIPPGQEVVYPGPPFAFFGAFAGPFIGSSTQPGNFFAIATQTSANAYGAATFNQAPTSGGLNYTQGDVSSLLSLTTCTATVAIAEVNGGSGTGPITKIATSPTYAGTGCFTGAGQATTGGTGSGATVNITAVTTYTAVSTPILCNFQMNGTGPYYPFNPPAQF